MKPRLDLQVLRQLLGQKKLDPKIIGRELAILKKLRIKYSPLEFWLGVKPAIPLDSLTYFFGYGAAALQDEWLTYQIGLAEKTRLTVRDIDNDIRTLENNLDTENKMDTIENRPKKQNAIEWADSI